MSQSSPKKSQVQLVGLHVRSVTPDDWPHIARLFGKNGACGGCWCMWWRVPKGGKTWDAVKGAKNRASLRQLIKCGAVHAVLAFAGDEPVGWCCFGPRSDFPRLETVKALRLDWTADTWAIVCFFIPSRWRRCGVATRLLKAATARAFELGAREVHGYPVPPGGASAPAAFVWTGVPALFEKAGYRQLARRGQTRPVFVKRKR
jgi:GNAT superfamily N-acetyltransferase